MRLTAKLVTVGSVVGARNGAWLTCTPSLVFHWLPSILKPSSLTKSSSLHPRVRPKDPRLCPLRGLFPLGWRQPWSFPLSYQRRGGCRVLVPSGLRHSGERVLQCQRPGGSRLPSPAPLAEAPPHWPHLPLQLWQGRNRAAQDAYLQLSFGPQGALRGPA